MGRPLKIKKSTTTDIGFNAVGTLTAPVNPAPLNSDQYTGVVGGAHTGVATAAYPVVRIRVFIAGASEADGWIIRQKGSTKYLVTDGTNTGVCVLANEAVGALSSGNMNIAMFNGDSTDILIARLTNKFATDFGGVQYATNFFTDEGSETKSGSETGSSLNMAIVENYTS